jgi:hypothetical protein
MRMGEAIQAGSILLELREPPHFVVHGHMATSHYVEGFDRILTSADVGAHDREVLGEECQQETRLVTHEEYVDYDPVDACVQCGRRREPTSHERPSSTEVGDGLLVSLPGSGSDERELRAQPSRRGMNGASDVLRFSEVDPRLRAELLAERLLLGASVDSDDAKPADARVLHGEVPEPTTGARDDEPVAVLRSRELQRAVGRHACAEDRRRGAAVHIGWDRRDVVRV